MCELAIRTELVPGVWALGWQEPVFVCSFRVMAPLEQSWPSMLEIVLRPRPATLHVCSWGTSWRKTVETLETDRTRSVRSRCHWQRRLGIPPLRDLQKTLHSGGSGNGEVSTTIVCFSKEKIPSCGGRALAGPVSFREGEKTVEWSRKWRERDSAWRGHNGGLDPSNCVLPSAPFTCHQQCSLSWESMSSASMSSPTSALPVSHNSLFSSLLENL
jgi:hypothetical protein